MGFNNTNKSSFLNSIPKASIELDTDRIAIKCKFNFSYFTCDQDKASDFSDITNLQLVRLQEKLVNYSKESLEHWQKMGIGNGKKRQHVLEVYGGFPKKSAFTHPIHIPHQALWARFRLEGDARLVGFVIPEEYSNQKQNNNKFLFCCNTFYIVFLDCEHNFYIS
jgi:hypothetical protein